MLLFVENHIPSNVFHLFHDAVKALESLTTSHVERKDVLQEWYQPTKVGVSEAVVQHMASFHLVLPTVFGRVKESSPASVNIVCLRSKALRIGTHMMESRSPKAV